MERILQFAGVFVAASLLAAQGNAKTVTWSGSDFNWDQPDYNSFSDPFTRGKDVVFDGAGTGTDITVAAGGVNPGNFALSAGTYRFIGGNINAGSFTISGGTLQYTNSAQLGSGTIYVTGNSTLESVRTDEPTLMNNAIMVSDGVMVTFKQHNPNNVDTTGPTVGAISGGSAGKPITVNLVGTATLQRWHLSPSTFIGEVNITGSRLYLEYFDTSHFGHVSNAVKITAGGFQADGTVEQNLEVTGAVLGGGFFDKLILNGVVTQTGLTQVPGTLRLNNPASTFETLALLGATLELSYLPATGFVRNHGPEDSTVRFLGDLTGSTGVELRNMADSTFYVDVASAKASVTITGSVISTATSRPFAKNGLGQLNLNGEGSLAGSSFYVNAGELNVNGTLSGVGNLTIGTGAKLGGSGTINQSSVSKLIFQNGAMVSPGNSPGSLTVRGGTTVINGAFTYHFELGNAVHDLLAVDALDLTGLTAGTLVVSSLVGLQTHHWRGTTPIPVFTFTSQTGFDPSVWTIINGGGMRVEGGYLFLEGNTIYLAGVSNAPPPSGVLVVVASGCLVLCVGQHFVGQRRRQRTTA